MKTNNSPLNKKDADQMRLEVNTLMKKFLYEVYKQIRSKRLTKSELAGLVGVTPSYLSQLFHGNKPVTFEMLVRFQRALNIKFEIEALPE